MQKKKLKINFADFWYGFSSANNYFVKVLSSKYEIEISDNPDFLFYSCYGTSYLKYKCIRIFYTAENIRPDFTGCDYAISFDYLKHKRHYRFPLYGIYIDQVGRPQKMQAKSLEEATELWSKKSKFCCMVVSNAASIKRIDFFNKLSKYKMVDSGGAVLNNVGGPVKDKMEFIQDYKFVLSFENSSYPGYTTEKIVEPFMADCIPIYWGDPVIEREFNKDAFLCLDKHKTEDDLMNEIIELDNDDSRAIKMLAQNKFVHNHFPDSINKEKILQFLDGIIETPKHPVALSYLKWVHLAKIKFKYYKKRILGIVLKK